MTYDTSSDAALYPRDITMRHEAMTQATKSKRVKQGTSKEAAAKRRKLFIEAYVSNGGNGLQAAIKAGFSPRSAGVTACQLLKEPNIRAEINRRTVEVLAIAQEKTGVTIATVLGELRALVHSDPRRFFDAKGKLLNVNELDADTAAALASFEVTDGRTKRIKLWDKNSAITNAMKHLGLFEEDYNQLGEALRAIIVPAKAKTRDSGIPIKR